MKAVTREALRWARIIAGFVLMITAFALGFVPGIPGFPLALVGLALLATEFLWAKKLNEWVKVKVKASVAKMKSKPPEQSRDEPG